MDHLGPTRVPDADKCEGGILPEYSTTDEHTATRNQDYKSSWNTGTRNSILD